jgi:hypothetical protein
MGFSPTTANYHPCSKCGGNAWQVVTTRARCTICGSVVPLAVIEVPLTRAQRQSAYQRRNIRRDSDDTETAHAKRLGGRKTRGSGCGPFDKADVDFQEELHELKETRAKTISLALADWVKIRTQALTRGKAPVMALTFIHGRSRTRLMVMDIDDYQALKEAARGTENT